MHTLEDGLRFVVNFCSEADEGSEAGAKTRHQFVTKTGPISGSHLRRKSKAGKGFYGVEFKFHTLAVNFRVEQKSKNQGVSQGGNRPRNLGPFWVQIAPNTP